MRHIALLVGAVLAFAIPLAAADHLPHHRLNVVGRVLDADGMPAPGLPVQLAFHGVEAGGACFDQGARTTGPKGDLALCQHVHAIPEGATVTLTVGGVSRTLPIRAESREVVAYLRLPERVLARDIQGDREFNRTFRVEGGAYNLYDRPVMTEEEPSTFVARVGENATVRLVHDDKTLLERNATIDERGRYSVDLPVTDIPEGARIRVEVADKQGGAPADPEYRRADVTIVRDLRTVQPTLERPGSEVPLAPWIVLAALALSAAAARTRR